MRPNGRGLASASEDGTVLVWDITPLSSANSTVRISPSSITSPLSGEHLRLSLEIEAAENVAGFQATIYFDPTALRYVESEAGDYLPDGSVFVAPGGKCESFDVGRSVDRRCKPRRRCAGYAYL